MRIPFNAESGVVIAERWRNWRRHAPINLVAKTRENLKFRPLLKARLIKRVAR